LKCSCITVIPPSLAVVYALLTCSNLLGEPQTFTIQVTPLRDLPLDLYILMDLSNSMSDELQSVKDISDQIGELG